MSKLTGKGLVAFARSKMGTPYVYGMKGTVMTQANFEYLQNKYGVKNVWNADERKVGQVCVDCSGLISWYTGKVMGSAQMYQKAVRRESIASIEAAPMGALVWMKGHVGIYTGMKKGEPYYIAADGSAFGVREVPLSKNKFTHWLLMEEVVYEDEGEDEMVEKDKIVVNGKEVVVEMIRKDGVTFVKTRDLVEALGGKVGNQGRVPVVEV